MPPRSLTALAEDPSSIPSTHVERLTRDHKCTSRRSQCRLLTHVGTAIHVQVLTQRHTGKSKSLKTSKQNYTSNSHKLSKIRGASSLREGHSKCSGEAAAAQACEGSADRVHLWVSGQFRTVRYFLIHSPSPLLARTFFPPKRTTNKQSR